MMGHAAVALGVGALVASTALLVWVSDKNGNSAQKVGKAIAWIAIIISALVIVGQAAMCYKMCKSGSCGREMGGKMGDGMGMEKMEKMMKMHQMMPGAVRDMEDKSDDKGEKK